MLRCLVCSKHYISRALLKEHVSKHIFNVPMYECRNCKQHFKDKASYLAHCKQAQFSNLCKHGYLYRNSFVCPLCGRRFIKKSTCVEHIQLHDEMVFDCAKCGWTFDTQYRVQVHKALRHGYPRVRLPTTMKKSSREESNSTRQNKVNFQPRKNSVNQSANANFDVQNATNENGNHSHKSSNRRKSTRKIFKKVFDDEWKPYAKMKYECRELNCKRQYVEYRDFQSHCKYKHNLDMTKQSAELYLISKSSESPIIESQRQIIPKKKDTSKSSSSSQWRNEMGEVESDATYEWETQPRIKRKIRKKVFDEHTETYVQRCEKRYIADKSMIRICSICGRNRIDQYHEKDHDKMIYKCPKPGCGWMYDNWGSFRSHCHRKHGISLRKDRQDCTCSICGRKDIDQNHEQEHDKMIYKCPKSGCGWMYQIWDNLYSHSRKKHGIKLRKDRQGCTCSICGRKDIDKYHEMEHDQMIHKCPESGCGWMYQNWASLYSHSRRKHGITLPKDNQDCTCSICGRQDIDQYHEQEHDQMIYKCPESGCGWMYQIWANLYNHSRRKHGITLSKDRQDRTCSICGRKDIDQYHEQEHDQMIYKCPESGCGWMYQIWVNLYSHSRRKHGITLSKDRQDHTCSICDQKDIDKYHEMEHDKMIYKCPKSGCGWMYENRNSLWTHCYREHGIRLREDCQDRKGRRKREVDCQNHTCSICGRKYTDQDHEKNHNKMIHKCPKSECGWMYDNWDSLRHHCRRKHNIDIQRNCQNHTCSICGRKNIDRDHEKDHDKMIHKCPKSGCGWMYENWTSLRSHSRRKHGFNLKWNDRTCSICGRKNIDRDHEKDHDKMIHKCPKSGCGWMYENWTALKSHSRKKHGFSLHVDVRTCSICGRKNIDRDHEKDHDKMIHKCPKSGCGWMYEHRSSLKSHCHRKHDINLNMVNKPVQSTFSSGLLDLNSIKRETRINIDEECFNEGEIVIGEARCDYQIHNVEGICVKIEPLGEADGENSRKREGNWYQPSFTENSIFDSSKFASTDALLAENQASRTCPLCGRENLNRRLYEHHVKNHNKLSYKCDEPNCGWVFEIEQGLWSHMQMKHNSTVLAASDNDSEDDFTIKEESLESENSSNSCEDDFTIKEESLESENSSNSREDDFTIKEESLESENSSNSCEDNENNVDVDKRILIYESENIECKQLLKFQCFENSNYKETADREKYEFI